MSKLPFSRLMLVLSLALMFVFGDESFVSRSMDVTIKESFLRFVMSGSAILCCSLTMSGIVASCGLILVVLKKI